MAAGRPRATVAQLKLHGLENNTREHTMYSDPDVSKNLITEIPDPPAHYSTRTKRAWNRILSGLINMRVLTDQDLDTLITGFDAYEEMIIAQRKIREFDRNNKDLDVNTIKNRRTLNSWMLASMAEANKAFAHFRW